MVMIIETTVLVAGAWLVGEFVGFCNKKMVMKAANGMRVLVSSDARDAELDEFVDSALDGLSTEKSEAELDELIAAKAEAYGVEYEDWSECNRLDYLYERRKELRQMTVVEVDNYVDEAVGLDLTVYEAEELINEQQDAYIDLLIKQKAVETFGLMTVVELKSICRERGLRGYSKLRKAELIALIVE
jgi:hypothetical protein